MKTLFTEYDFYELPIEMAVRASQLANEKLIKASTRVYLISDALESSTYISTTTGCGHPFTGYLYNIEPRAVLEKK
jgi:hypothetical protein